MVKLIRALLFLMASFFVFLAPAPAETIRMTTYGDGDSCPNNCDSHVVFANSMNGTEFAHMPGTQRDICVKDQPCEICLESGPKQCLTVMYRGGGPKKGTFDLTDAFFEERCAKTDNPALLQVKCVDRAKDAKALNGRLNCIRNPGQEQCKEMMKLANERKEADAKIYEQCKAMTEGVFNRGKPLAEQRSKNCAYSAASTGSNTKGTIWQKLQPGACPARKFVGSSGLDCCTGFPSTDGPLDLECRGFYPKPLKPTRRVSSQAKSL